MSDLASTPSEALRLTGQSEAHVPNVLRAEAHSLDRTRRARAIVPVSPLVVIALGSHGRLEASAASDLDLACLFDPAAIDATAAARHREAAVAALRAAGFDVPEKTFRRALPLTALLANVGGEGDTHESLTHRALVLTESAWLSDAPAAEAAWSRLFALYRDGSTRGQHMTSLLNDLHRYYRTVCLDYRHKVEETDKGWALRYLKLRHSRKAWHLGNLVLHCAARAVAGADAAEHDAWLAARLRQPPLVKIAGALDALGYGALAGPAWRCLDAFLGVVAREGVRDELESLPSGAEGASVAFQELKENAARLDAAAEDVVEALLDDTRTRGHLVRFGLL